METTPPESMCLQFRVQCGACGSYNVRAKIYFYQHKVHALLGCRKCWAKAEAIMRQPVPQSFHVTCRCGSVRVSPSGDDETGRVVFACADCQQQEQLEAC